jgi:hypothetical protein
VAFKNCPEVSYPKSFRHFLAPFLYPFSIAHQLSNSLYEHLAATISKTWQFPSIISEGVYLYIKINDELKKWRNPQQLLS